MRKHFLLTFLLQSILIRSETMASTTIPRDYSLIGPEAQKAKDKGLASATWYATPIPRKRMKELMRRSDQPAIRDTAIWLGFSTAVPRILVGTSAVMVPHFAPSG